MVLVGMYAAGPIAPKKVPRFWGEVRASGGVGAAPNAEARAHREGRRGGPTRPPQPGCLSFLLLFCLKCLLPIIIHLCLFYLLFRFPVVPCKDIFFQMHGCFAGRKKILLLSAGNTARESSMQGGEAPAVAARSAPHGRRGRCGPRRARAPVRHREMPRLGRQHMNLAILAFASESIVSY